MKIKIGDKIIGKNEPVFIIAEAGVNHNGNFDLAKKLIDIAKNSNADAVKFQTFKAEELITINTEMVKYQRKNVATKEKQQQMLKKLELDYDDFKELKKYCDRKNIIFLSTPHTEDAIDFLEPLIPAYKIGSGDLTNIPFLKKVAVKGKPIILSTGMATMEEVEDSLKVLYTEGNKQVVILHCTTNYPCPLEEVNLRAMQSMQKELNCLVGYSDHTIGILTSIAAIAMGARIIEKHFTLDKNLPGPDHKASLEPAELKKMIHDIRNVENRFKKGEKIENILKTIPNIEKILGDPNKKPTKSEEKIKKLIRKSIVANVDIPKGTIITKNMLSIKRPGTGIAPKYIDDIIGREVKKNIKQDELISFRQLI
jgi:N-acetylneuraminate synthase/N,N'-diacetyllegionaminate synthase